MMPITAKSQTHSTLDSPKGNSTNILVWKYTTCEYPSSSSSSFLEETNQNLELKIN
jgi:hypothetical protein